MSEKEDAPKPSTCAAEGEETWIQQQLRGLNHEITTALTAVLENKKGMSDSEIPFSDVLKASHVEAKKKLEEHKLHLQHLIALHYSHQMDVLKKLFQQQLQQFLVTKTEEKNYEARLADLQLQVMEKIWETDSWTVLGECQHHATEDTVRELKQAWRHLAQQKPTAQVDRKTLEAVLPDVTFSDLGGLMGTVTLSTDGHQHCDLPLPQQQCPATLVPQQQCPAAPVPQQQCPATLVPHQECPDPKLGAMPGDHLTPADSPESLQAGPESGEKVVASHLSRPAKFCSRSVSSAHKPKAGSGTVPLKNANTVNVSAATDKQLPSKKGKQDKKSKGKKNPKDSDACKKGGKGPAPLTRAVLEEGRERLLSRYREVLATEKSHKSGTQPHNWVSLTVLPDSSPRLLCSRSQQPTAMAPRPDGKVWMLYRGLPSMDLVDRQGKICQTTSIDSRPMQLAAYGKKDVLVVHAIPQSLTFYTEGQHCFAVFGKPKYKSLVATTSEIVASFFKGIFVLSLEGGMTWVRVCPDYKQLQLVSSVAVLTYQGRLMICAADKGKKLVHFFLRESPETFTACSPFGSVFQQSKTQRKEQKQKGHKVLIFNPVCVSAHPAGFVAVLDTGCQNIYVIDVSKIKEVGLNGMDCVVSVISGDSVCVGVPHLIAFGVQDRQDSPNLYVASKTGQLYVTPLLFLPW